MDEAEKIKEQRVSGEYPSIHSSKAYFLRFLRPLNRPKILAGRLIDAQLETVKKNSQLQVYLMLWKNPLQVETYSSAIERFFAAMITHPGRLVFYALCAGSKSGVFFSPLPGMRDC